MLRTCCDIIIKNGLFRLINANVHDLEHFVESVSFTIFEFDRTIFNQHFAEKDKTFVKFLSFFLQVCCRVGVEDFGKNITK